MTKTTLGYTIPDFSPVLAFWTRQAETAMLMNLQMMKLAMAPWQAMGLPFVAAMTGPVAETAARPAAARKPAAPAAPSAAASAGQVAPRSTPAAPASTSAPKARAEAAAPAARSAATPKAQPAPAEPRKPAAPAVTPSPEAAKPAAAAKPAPAASQPAAASPPAPAAGTAKATAAPVAEAKAPPAPAPAAQDTAGSRPAGLKTARGGVPDNLQAIKGVGPKLEEALNALGIFHYDQIAGWTQDEIAWADENVPGSRRRVSRDDWKTQAAALARGDGA